MALVESKVRTDKLFCSDCRRKIKKGETALFDLNEDQTMEDVYCDKCSINHEDIDGEVHPHSSEALGQD